jgi:hypothetical protein
LQKGTLVLLAEMLVTIQLKCWITECCCAQQETVWLFTESCV